MDFKPLEIPDVKLFSPDSRNDERGSFYETFRLEWFAQAGIPFAAIQENHAVSRRAGTIRGLHFQYGSAAQAKLIRCLKGEIIDCAVDIRTGAPTFGQHVLVRLKSEEGKFLFVPPGFAHGYLTMSDDAEVLYKTDQYYDPDREAGIRWNDPDLLISWPVAANDAITSLKDQNAPRLSEIANYFEYDRTKPYNVHCNKGR